MSNDRNPGTPLSRRRFLSIGAAATAGLGVAPLAGIDVARPATAAPAMTPVVPEWRNRQEGMAYRMLGRTGMMISEVVSGLAVRASSR